MFLCVSTGLLPQARQPADPHQGLQARCHLRQARHVSAQRATVAQNLAIEVGLALRRSHRHIRHYSAHPVAGAAATETVCEPKPSLSGCELEDSGCLPECMCIRAHLLARRSIIYRLYNVLLSGRVRGILL